MFICKASEIPRNEAYIKYAAVTRDEGNAADGRFKAASGGDDYAFKEDHGKIRGCIDVGVKNGKERALSKRGHHCYSI